MVTKPRETAWIQVLVRRQCARGCRAALEDRRGEIPGLGLDPRRILARCHPRPAHDSRRSSAVIRCPASALPVRFPICDTRRSAPVGPSAEPRWARTPAGADNSRPKPAAQTINECDSFVASSLRSRSRTRAADCGLHRRVGRRGVDARTRAAQRRHPDRLVKDSSPTMARPARLNMIGYHR